MTPELYIQLVYSLGVGAIVILGLAGIAIAYKKRQKDKKLKASKNQPTEK